MKEVSYLFIFNDNGIYEVNNAVSFKDAVLEMAKNTGNSSDMFCKCLTAYKDDDIEIAQSEAYKEFAERLKEKSFQSFGNYGITRDVVEVCDIDNLIKEIIGE